MSPLTPARYRQLPKGKFTLVYLGNLFFKPAQGWYVAVWLKAENGQLSSHSFRFEALTDLRIGQQFVDGVVVPEPVDRTFSLTLPPINCWHTEPAGSVIPSRLWSLYGERELCHQNVFLISLGEREYVIPVIELARALLIPKKAVAKHILTPSGLSGIALKCEDQPYKGHIELKFKPDIPLYLIDDVNWRNHLVWMLMHEQPGKLFNSVFKHVVLQQNQSLGGNYKRFAFYICLSPPLSGINRFVRNA